MFNSSVWMASRCAENSVAEEGFQYPLFKQTLEKVKRKNMAPHIQFLENQCPLKFWVTTNSTQSPIKAYGRALFLRSLRLSFFCGCFFFFFPLSLLLVFWTQKHSGPSFLLWYVLCCSRSSSPLRLHISLNGRRTQTRLSWLTDSFSSHQQWLTVGDRAAWMDIALHKPESFLSSLSPLAVRRFLFLS